MLARSGLFVKLTGCIMLTGICMEGMYELLGQYFQLKLNYTVQDQVRALFRLPSLFCASKHASLLLRHILEPSLSIHGYQLCSSDSHLHLVCLRSVMI